MSEITDPARQVQRGRTYRIKHQTRGVFEGTVQCLDIGNKKYPRDWFTCVVTKTTSKGPPIGQHFGGYFDLVEKWRDITPEALP